MKPSSSNAQQQHVSGPHRKLQLLGSSLTQPMNTPSNGNTLESNDNTPKGKGGTVKHSSTTVKKSTPSKIQGENVSQSPRPSVEAAQNVVNTSNNKNMRASFSGNQLSYTLVSVNQANSSSNKSFQPVLTKKVDLTQGKQTEGGVTVAQGNSRTPSISGNANIQNMHARKSAQSFSSLADKVNHTGVANHSKNKSGSKVPVLIKEQPFNYEERQKSADHHLSQSKSNSALTNKSPLATVGQKVTSQEDAASFKEIQKSLTYEPQLQQQRSSDLVTHRAIDRTEIQMVEIFSKDDPTSGNLYPLEDRDEVRMRPSDEVSMNQEHQLLLAALGSGFTHSRIGSGQNWGIEGQGVGKRFIDTNANSSYRVLIEENKSDTKNNLTTTMGGNDYMVIEEKFEVIREPGTEDKDDGFYSPAGGNRLQSQLTHPRDNSDLKKFTDDDQERAYGVNNHSNYWPSSSIPRNFGGNSIEYAIQEESVSQRPVLTLCAEDETGKQENCELEDTPKNIKDRAKKSFFEQQVQNAMFNNNDGNPNTKLTQSSNFGGPIQQQNQNAYPYFDQPQTQAHVLSFSEDHHPTTSNQGTDKNDHPLLNLDDPSAAPHFQHTNQQTQQPQSANQIIEVEKNFVILQYETLLSQLSSEFQKLLAKTKDTDDHVAQQEYQIQALRKLLEDKEGALFQSEQLNTQLQHQVQDLLRDMECLQANAREESVAEKERSEQRERTLASRVRLHESQEIVYKEQIEQMQTRIRALEGRVRQKEEELYSVQRVVTSMERDMQNMMEVENSLKMELQRGVTSRMAVEEQMQELRQRANADQIMLRLRESEAENLHRENKAIKGSLETLQHSLTQVMRENDQLKITLNEHERLSIQMKSLFSTRDAQMSQLESDNERLRGVIEKERQTSRKLEESLKSKIDQLQNELRDASTRQEITNPPQRSFDHTNRNNYNSHDESKMGGMLSPHRSLEENNPPPISWLSSKPKNEYQQQSVVPQAQQRASHTSMQLPQDPKKRIVNQNMSQLNDVLQWQNQQGIPNNASYKSLERVSAVNTQNNTYFAQGRQEQQNPRQQQRNPSAQYSPRVNMQQQSRLNNSFGDDYGHHQQIIPAAGKKSNLDTSPFAATHESHQKQMSHLQNTLSAMQIDKERIENEYRKLGTSKNKQQIERKKELEFEVEVIDKNIHQIKQKLRELNAL